MCKTGKRVFAYEKAAEREARRIRKRSDSRFMWYRCPECGGFHLTTADEGGEPLRRRARDRRIGRYDDDEMGVA